MRSAKSMEWMANDLVRCMCETLFLSLSLSLPLPLTHSFVHSNVVVVVVVFGCCWKNCFAFKTRVFSLSQNMSFHLILVMHSQLTHTQSRTHTISVLSAIELLNLAPYRYAISITTTTKAKKSDTQMTMKKASGNEKWMRQIVSLKLWTTRKKERNIPNIITLEQASEPSPSMDYKCWACVMIGFKIGLVLHPSIHFVSHFVCFDVMAFLFDFDFDVTVDFVIFSNGWQRVLIFKFCKRSPSNHKFVWVCVCVLNHEWRRRRRCKPP